MGELGLPWPCWMSIFGSGIPSEILMVLVSWCYLSFYKTLEKLELFRDLQDPKNRYHMV